MPAEPAVAPASKGLIPQPVSMSALSLGGRGCKRQAGVGSRCLAAAHARFRLQRVRDLRY